MDNGLIDWVLIAIFVFVMSMLMYAVVFFDVSI